MVRHLIDTFKHNNLVIKVFNDPDSNKSPRDEIGVLGTMALWHHQYQDIGDPHPFKDLADLQEHFNKEKCLSLPVYLVEDPGSRLYPYIPHGTNNATAIGYIFVSYKDLRMHFRAERIGAVLERDARKLLEREILAYSNFLNGDIYGYMIEDSAGNLLDCKWGLTGSAELHKAQARMLADSYSKALPRHTGGKLGSQSC